MSTAPTAAAVAALTEQVQAAIDCGDWAAASELEADRRAALEALLAAELIRGVHEQALRAQLTALVVRTRGLIGEVNHHQRRLEREAAMLSTGRKAALEYGRAARGR